MLILLDMVIFSIQLLHADLLVVLPPSPWAPIFFIFLCMHANFLGMMILLFQLVHGDIFVLLLASPFVPNFFDLLVHACSSFDLHVHACSSFGAHFWTSHNVHTCIVGNNNHNNGEKDKC